MGSKQVLLELSVPRVSAIFVPPEGAPHPTIWLTVKFPGEDRVHRTPACAYSGDHYPVGLKQTFSRTATGRLYNELLSQPVVITVYKDAPPPPVQIKPDAKAKAKGEKPREVEAPLPPDFICRLALDLSPLLQGSSSVGDEENPFSSVNDAQDEKLKVNMDPSISVAVTALEVPAAAEGAAEGAEAAAPAEGGAAPAPAALLSQAEFAKCHVLEMSVKSIRTEGGQPIPPELVATLDKGTGVVHFVMAAPVPTGPAAEALLLVLEGRLNSDKTGLAFPYGTARVLLDPAAASYMTSNLDNGSLVPVEMARLLKKGADFSDPAAPRYHVVGQLDLSPLIHPGAALVPATVRLAHSFAAALEAGVLKATRIPEAPHTEGQPIEELPADATPESPGPSVLEPLGIVAEVELRMFPPLLAPWVAPEPPTTTLAEVIPPKGKVSDMQKEQASSADAFRDRCRSIAREIAHEYLRQSGGAGGAADPGAHAERQKEMRFWLNRSGRFQQVREVLRASVVDVVKARLANPGAVPTAEELAPLYNDVYMCLVSELHAALDEVFRPRPAGEEDVRGPGEAKAAALAQLAAECEAVAAWPRAQQLLLDSLLGSRDPAAWLRYGAFLCRKGDLGPAEEAVREAVALDAGFTDALLAIAALFLELGAREDGLRHREAEVIAQAARLQQPESPRAWAMLAAVYSAIGPSKAQEAANSLYESRRLAREVHGVDQSDGLLKAASLALDLSLPYAAEAIVRLLPPAASMQQQAQYEAEIAQARLQSLKGDTAAALDAARRAAALSDSPEDLRVHLLKADCCHRAGRTEEVALQYQIAVQKAQAVGSSLPMVAYLRLGSALWDQGDLQGALKAYLLGATEAPCASAWLGAGRCLLRLGDLDRADLALTEASTLDNQNPDVWGLMAAVALAQGRAAEAEQSLKYALKFGFSDPAVLKELAGRYFGEGSFRMAEGVLKRALMAGDDPLARLLLGESLLEQREAREAKVEVLKALRALEEGGALGEDVRARATRLLHRAAVELGEAPPADLREGGSGGGGGGGGGLLASGSGGGSMKRPYERVMVFLGSETVH